MSFNFQTALLTPIQIKASGLVLDPSSVNSTKGLLYPTNLEKILNKIFSNKFTEALNNYNRDIPLDVPIPSPGATTSDTSSDPPEPSVKDFIALAWPAVSNLKLNETQKSAMIHDKYGNQESKITNLNLVKVLDEKIHSKFLQSSTLSTSIVASVDSYLMSQSLNDACSFSRLLDVIEAKRSASNQLLQSSAQLTEKQLSDYGEQVSGIQDLTNLGYGKLLRSTFPNVQDPKKFLIDVLTSMSDFYGDVSDPQYATPQATVKKILSSYPELHDILIENLVFNMGFDVVVFLGDTDKRLTTNTRETFQIFDKKVQDIVSSLESNKSNKDFQIASQKIKKWYQDLKNQSFESWQDSLKVLAVKNLKLFFQNSKVELDPDNLEKIDIFLSNPSQITDLFVSLDIEDSNKILSSMGSSIVLKNQNTLADLYVLDNLKYFIEDNGSLKKITKYSQIQTDTSAAFRLLSKFKSMFSSVNSSLTNQSFVAAVSSTSDVVPQDMGFNTLVDDKSIETIKNNSVLGSGPGQSLLIKDLFAPFAGIFDVDTDNIVRQLDIIHDQYWTSLKADLDSSVFRHEIAIKLIHFRMTVASNVATTLNTLLESILTSMHRLDICMQSDSGSSLKSEIESVKPSPALSLALVRKICSPVTNVEDHISTYISNLLSESSLEELEINKSANNAANTLMLSLDEFKNNQSLMSKGIVSPTII